jgi:hypothetical protein
VFYPKFCSGESVTCCCTAMSDDPCGPSKSKSTGVLGKVQPSKCFNAPLFGTEKQLFWGDDCTLSNLLVRFRGSSCQGLVNLIERAREGWKCCNHSIPATLSQIKMSGPNHTGLQTESMSSSQRWRLTTIPRNGELVGLTVTCPKRDLPLNLTDKYSTFAGD